MDCKEFIEIALSCCSTRQNVSLGCGVSYEKEGLPINLDDTDWIWSGLTECFWENFFEFEEGIAAANDVLVSGEKSTLHDALHEVFGKFDVEYTVNGEATNLEYGVDVEEIIYNLLMESCGFE